MVFCFILKLKAKRLKYKSIINLAFNFKLLGIDIRPAQVKEEIVSLLKILRNIKPKIILEIGTGSGGTLFLFTKVSSYDATIISIDLPGKFLGGGYSIFRIPLYKSFATNKQKIYLLRSNSHKK